MSYSYMPYSYNGTTQLGPPGIIDSWFVSPGCANDIYEEPSEQKWIECAVQRGRATVATAGVVVAVMLVIAMLLIPSPVGKIIAIVVAAAIMGYSVYSGIVNAEWTARYQFASAQKDLAAAGYDANLPYSAQERVEKRAAAVSKIRAERRDREFAALGAAALVSLLPGRPRMPVTKF